MRDAVFGVTYELLRTECRRSALDPSQQSSKLLCNTAAGAAATILSGPFNYARNMQYALPVGDKAPSTLVVVRQLWVEAAQEPSALARLRFLQIRLRIGWGSLRVAVGMALGQALFDTVRSGCLALGDP